MFNTSLSRGWNMQKLYCHADETGQDTKGTLYIPAVIVTSGDVDELLGWLGQIENLSGKGRLKWGRAVHVARLNYFRRIFADVRLKGTLRYSLARNTTKYDHEMVNAVARAVRWSEPEEYEARIYVDALSNKKCY